jgi:S1-C subfamily serine protease
MTQIIEKGYVVRGWLGIEAQNMTPQLAKTVGLTYTRGILIGAVISDGPAADAGLLPGDILVTINGETVVETNEVMKAISLQQPGTIIELTGVRKGMRFTTRAQVEQRPGRNNTTG